MALEINSPPDTEYFFDEECDRRQLHEGPERDLFEVNPPNHARQNEEGGHGQLQESVDLVTVDARSMGGKIAFGACIATAAVIGCSIFGWSLIDGVGAGRCTANATVVPNRRDNVHLHFINQDIASDPEGYTASDQVNVQSEAPVATIPPLSDLVHRQKIKGDVSWMMDFAILGFAKCGTTYLMHWLEKSDETYLNHGEVCKLDKNQPASLVELYYDKVVSEGKKHVLSGLKCPKGLETRHGLKNWARYFPKTNFIVSVRHPVLHFQSFYNFRAYHTYPNDFPSPEQLIGACQEDSSYICGPTCDRDDFGICTDRSKFHHALSRLGKTPMSSPEERGLLQHHMRTWPVSGKIFLLELSQLYPENPASNELAKDLRDFIGLENDLSPLRGREGMGVNNHEYTDPEKKSAFINICDSEHAALRTVLVEIGREASQWIRNYFLKSPDVVTSSPDLFVELLKQWGKDPCDGKDRV